MSSAKYPTSSQLQAARRRSVAQDVKARGGNPVSVSDLKQRHGMGNTEGRPFLTTLLKWGRSRG